MRALPREPALGLVSGADFDVVVEGPGQSLFGALTAQARTAEMSTLGGLRLIANDDLRHREMHSATYLLRGERPEYRLWFSAGAAELVISRNFTGPDVRKVKRAVTALLRRPDADGALSLVGRTSAADQDATVEFLVAFTALEQYVKAHTASGTLVAKFAELASRSHAPTQVSADVNEFKALYRVRNRLAHEGQLPDGRDHGRRVRVLLARYLG